MPVLHAAVVVDRRGSPDSFFYAVLPDVLDVEGKMGDLIARPNPVWDSREILPYIPEAGFIRNYVEYALRCTDAPPLYHILSAIGVVSTAVAPQMDLVFEGKNHPLHLYLLLVGDSSRSRKSSAIKRVYSVAGPVFDAVSHRGARLWWPAVSSPEGIIEELSHEPNRLCLLSEWTDLQRLSQAGYWKHNAEFWNVLYDAIEEQHRARSKTLITITRPRVSVLAASTKMLVQASTAPLDWHSGKMARYLIGCESRPRDRHMDAEVDEPETLPALRAALGMLMTKLGKDAVLSSEAWEVIRAWEHDNWWQDLKSRAGGHLQPSMERAQEHVFRIAALYEASSCPSAFRTIVSPGNAERAIRLVEWCMDSLNRTFTLLHDDGQDNLTRVYLLIQAAGQAGVKRSDLIWRAKLSSKQLNEILATLREAVPDGGDLVEEPVRAKGKTNIVYRLTGQPSDM